MAGEEGSLPPVDGEMSDISERLQDYNQKIQEQAFLLGYRNGFREGSMLEDTLYLAREQMQTAPSEAERNAWQDVVWYLQQQGAAISDEDEITHPPGFDLYLGALDATPMIQVAGQRVHVNGFHFDWLPNPHAQSVDDFEPHRETATIELEIHLELPKDSDQRDELMQLLDGLR